MRRYYMAKLNNIQLFIKILIASVIFIGIYLITLSFIKLNLDDIYKNILIPIILLFIILLINIANNNVQRSFYFKDNNMIICHDNKERSLIIESINLIELLTDIDSLFGLKKVLIYREGSKKKYKIILVKEQAKKFIFWLNAKLNDNEKLIDDLQEFFED